MAAPPDNSSSSPAWLEDCPVQDDDPSQDGLEQPSLAPGPVLEACSGSDIRLQKSATAINAKYPKYLAILPGVLSLNAKPKGFSGGADVSKQSGQEEEDDDTKQPVQDMATVEDSTAKPKSSNEPRILGKLHHHRSDAPSLEIPMGTDSRLHLRGTRIPSSSKFLLLTVQPRKKQVVCRNVFQSVVVFGDPQVQGKEDDEDSKLPADAELRHYGGSVRASGGKASARSTFVSSSSSLKAARDSLPEEDDDDEEDDVEQVLRDDDDEDEFKIVVDSPVERRSAPRRASRKTIRYQDMDNDNDDASPTDSDSEEESSDRPIKKQTHKYTEKNRRSQKRKASPSITQSQEDDVENTSADRAEPVLLLQSDDSYQEPVTRKPRRRSNSQSQRKAKNVIDVDAESNDSDDKNVNANKSTVPKRKLVSRTVNLAETVDEDSSSADVASRGKKSRYAKQRSQKASKTRVAESSERNEGKSLISPKEKAEPTGRSERPKRKFKTVNAYLVGSDDEAEAASDDDAHLKSGKKKVKPTKQRPMLLSKAKTVDVVGSESEGEIGSSNDKVDAEKATVDTDDEDYEDSIKKKHSSRQSGPSSRPRKASMASKTKSDKNDHKNAIDDKGQEIAARREPAQALKKRRRMQRENSEDPDENAHDSSNRKRLASSQGPCIKPGKAKQQQTEVESVVEDVEEAPGIPATPDRQPGRSPSGSSLQSSGRRRRKVPKKKSPARRNEVNLLDDEFTFLG